MRSVESEFPLTLRTLTRDEEDGFFVDAELDGRGQQGEASVRIKCEAQGDLATLLTASFKDGGLRVSCTIRVEQVGDE